MAAVLLECILLADYTCYSRNSLEHLQVLYALGIS